MNGPTAGAAPAGGGTDGSGLRENGTASEMIVVGGRQGKQHKWREMDAAGAAHGSSVGHSTCGGQAYALTLLKIIAAPAGSTRAARAPRNDSSCCVLYLACAGGGYGRGTGSGVRS
jgi:hypothetical protein